MLDGEAVVLGAGAFALIFGKLGNRPGGIVVCACGGDIPGGRPAPDVVIILGLVAGYLPVDRALFGLGVVLGSVHRVGNLAEGAVAVILEGGLIMVEHFAGAPDFHILIVIEDAVVMVDFPLGSGLLRTGGEGPAGLAEHPVFFYINIADPADIGDLQIAGGFVAVHPGKDADEGQDDDGDDDQRFEGALLLRIVGMLGGVFGGLFLLLFLQAVEVIGLGIGTGCAAVGADIGLIAVEGIAEGAIPVGIAAHFLGLLFIQALELVQLFLPEGIPLGIALDIKLYVSAGTAAGRAVGYVAADFLVAADGAVPVAHDKFSHNILLLVGLRPTPRSPGNGR